MKERQISHITLSDWGGLCENIIRTVHTSIKVKAIFHHQANFPYNNSNNNDIKGSEEYLFCSKRNEFCDYFFFYTFFLYLVVVAWVVVFHRCQFPWCINQKYLSIIHILCVTKVVDSKINFWILFKKVKTRIHRVFITISTQLHYNVVYPRYKEKLAEICKHLNI